MKTVFVLEDEKNIREALEILLSFENYQVISCTNVSDCIIIMDRQVPEMN